MFLQRDRATSPWYYWRGTARRCETCCYCRGTARRHGFNGEGQIEGPCRVKIVTTPIIVDYFATILPAAQNVLATIWPLIEILRPVVNKSVSGPETGRPQAQTCIKPRTYSRLKIAPFADVARRRASSEAAQHHGCSEVARRRTAAAAAGLRDCVIKFKVIKSRSRS